MINILGKVNKRNYKNFSNKDFSGFEIFLGSEKDFKYLPAIMRRLPIVSVHEPARNFDLASPGPKGSYSYRLIIRLLTQLKKLGFKGVMVIHGAFYNEINGTRRAGLEILADRVSLAQNQFPEIRISLETDILFFNQILDNRALLARPEDFFELNKLLKTPLFITLDFEHVLISALFENFINQTEKNYLLVENLDDLNKPEILKLKASWLGYIKSNQANFDKIFSAALKKYEKLKRHIIHFHLSPSDMLNYWYDENIFAPLKGEHLSVKQKNDRLNYQLIKKFLPRLTKKAPINVVIEIWPRGEKIRQRIKKIG